MRLRIDGPLRDAARRLTVVVFAGWVVLVGCQPAEQVSKYTVPHEALDPDAISDEPDEGEPNVRVLGAIVPVGKPDAEDWYFLKMQPGPPKAVERHAAAFDQFIRSLKFAPEGPPSWTLPAGWHDVGTLGKERVATIRMKKSETPVELAVTRFGGPLLANINRWRVEQAGAEPITEPEIDTKCRVLTVDGRKVVIVDVSGPGGKGGMMPPSAK